MNDIQVLFLHVNYLFVAVMLQLDHDGVKVVLTRADDLHRHHIIALECILVLNLFNLSVLLFFVLSTEDHDTGLAGHLLNLLLRRVLVYLLSLLELQIKTVLILLLLANALHRASAVDLYVVEVIVLRLYDQRIRKEVTVHLRYLILYYGLRL